MFEFHKQLNKKGFLNILLDSRLRGNDVTFVSSTSKNFFAKVSAFEKQDTRVKPEYDDTVPVSYLAISCKISQPNLPINTTNKAIKP